MFTRSDHFSDASQANAEAQVALSTSFGRKALESAKRFLDLHVAAVKASMQYADVTIRELIAVRDSREFWAQAIMQTRPVSQKVFSYACHGAGIATGAQADFIELFAAQATTTCRESALLVGEVSKNAPPGLNLLGDFLRSLLEHASAGCEHISLATRSAMDALESNLISAANQFAHAAEQSAAGR